MKRERRDCDDDLLDACDEGTFEDALKALEAGANPNTSDETSKTALMIACDRESDWHEVELIVELLLKRGAICSVQNKRGFTALHYAVSSSSGSVVKLLVSAWPFVDMCDQEGDTPLTHLFTYNHFRDDDDTEVMLKLLLDAGAIPSEHAFSIACSMENINVIRLLLNAKANPNAKERENQNSALQNACLNRYHGVDIIPELIKAGAVIDEDCIRMAYQANADLFRTILLHNTIRITEKNSCQNSADPVGCLRIGKRINFNIACFAKRAKSKINTDYLWALVRTRSHLVCCGRPHTNHDCFATVTDPRFWRLLSIEMREQYDPVTWNTLLHTAVLTGNVMLVDQVMKSNANPFLHNVEDLLPIEMTKDVALIAKLKEYMRFRPSQVYMEWRGPYFRKRVFAFLLVCKRLVQKLPRDVINIILGWVAENESH